MVHSEVLCPNLLSLVYTDGYVADTCICWHLEMCHREGAQLKQTQQSTQRLLSGVNGEGLSCQSLACSNCMECVSTHQSQSRGSVQSAHTCTVRLNKMHPTDKLNRTPRGGGDCVWETVRVCISVCIIILLLLLLTISLQNI